MRIPLLVLFLIISSFVALSFLQASIKIQPAFWLASSNLSVALAHRVAVVTFAPMVSSFRVVLLKKMAKVSPVQKL
jgi:hypothetical protein